MFIHWEAPKASTSETDGSLGRLLRHSQLLIVDKAMVWCASTVTGCTSSLVQPQVFDVIQGNKELDLQFNGHIYLG